MIGLLWKDLLVARKTILSYFVFMLLYCGMAVMGRFSIHFVTGFLSILVMMLPMTAIPQ